MAKNTLGDVLLQLRKTWAVHEARDLTDGELLERFLTAREDAAFAVLVHRHGPMVLSVCQRVLGDLHAAEDAFQATFMVLVRRAGSIRKNAPLARWLYAVAHRLAMRARAQTAARRRRERQLEPMPHRDQLDELTWQELRSVLDEEIVRLPKKYQAAIVLCYLEGKTHDQAAKELGCPKTTLTCRLDRARELLRQNLVRRGIALSAGAVAAALSQKAAAAPVAALLTLSTVKAATSVAAGQTLASVGLSAGALALAEHGMRATFWMKAKVLLLVLLLGFGAGGAGLAGFGALTGKSPPVHKATAQVPTVQAAPAPVQDNEAEKLFRAMEKKIVAAKSLKVVFEVEMGSNDGVQYAKGSGWFGEANKARLELGLANPDRKLETFLIVSDGKQISVRPNKGADMGGPLKTPPRLNSDLALILARNGGFIALAGCPMLAAQDQQTDINKVVWAKAFKLGPKERIGPRDALTIEYTAALVIGDRKGDSGKVKVWIDSKTMLPLKRSIDLPVQNGEKKASLTEMYTEFVLDPPLDGKLFEIQPLVKEKTERLEKTTDGSKKKAVAVDLYGDSLPEAATARLGTLRFRGGTSTRVIGFMPGGRVLASKSVVGASWDQQRFAIDFWDAATGQRLRQLPVPRGEATAVAFSPDGKLLLTSLPSLVDVATERDLDRLNGFGNEYNMVAFSPDGRTVAGAVFRSKFNSDQKFKKVLLWDVSSGDVIGRLESHPEEVWALAFSPDSKTLATACGDKKVRLWDVAGSKELWQAEGQDDGINSIAFSPNGKMLAAAAGDGTVRLLDAKTGAILQTTKETNGILKVVAFSPDGKLLAAGGDSGNILLWDVESAKELRKWRAHAERITSVAFSPDSKVVVSGAYSDHAIRLWDTDTGRAINPSGGHTGAVDWLQFTADGKRLYSMGWDAKLLEWDLATGRDVGRLFAGPLETSGTGPLRAASRDGKMVAVASHAWFGGKTDPVIRLMDTATGKQIRALGGQREQQWHFCFSPDGKLLASRGDDGIRLWDVGTGKQLHLIVGEEFQVLAFSPDSKQLASAGNGKISFWDAASGKEVRSWPSHLPHFNCLTFSDDGKMIAAADFGGYCVWTVGTGKELLRFGTLDIKKATIHPKAVAFSPSGRVLAVGGVRYESPAGKNASADSMSFVHLWDMWSGEKIREIDGLESAAWSLAFSPDGRSLAIGGDNSTVLLWDLVGDVRSLKNMPVQLTAAEFDELWADLGANAAKADRAIWTLAGMLVTKVKPLRDRLQPIAPADAQQVARLVTELGSDQFAVRQKAVQALTDLSESAETALRKVLESNPPLEVRQRLEKILEKRDQDPEIIRRLRAVEALEHMGTTQARQVLQLLATSAPNPRLSQAASAALQRLEK